MRSVNTNWAVTAADKPQKLLRVLIGIDQNPLVAFRDDGRLAQQLRDRDTVLFLDQQLAIGIDLLLQHAQRFARGPKASLVYCTYGFWPPRKRPSTATTDDSSEISRGRGDRRFLEMASPPIGNIISALGIFLVCGITSRSRIKLLQNCNGKHCGSITDTRELKSTGETL